MNNWEELKVLQNIIEMQREIDKKENLERGKFDYLIATLLLELKDRIDTLEEQIRYQQKMAYGSLRDI